MDGVNLGKPQIQIEWDKFNEDTKKNLFNILNPLVKKIGKDNIYNVIKANLININKTDKTISNQLINSNKIIKLIKFLLYKNFFVFE